MQKRFTNQEITAIRSEFSGHLIYRMAENVLSVFDPQLQNIGITTEELFYEVARIIDDIKEQGDAFVIDGLWKRLYGEYRILDSTITQEERQLLICLIASLSAIVLTASDDGTHQIMSEDMMLMAKKNYPETGATLQSVFGTFRHLQAEIDSWIQDFMLIDNDEYLSDTITSAMRGKSGKKQPKEFIPINVAFSRKNATDGQIDMLYQFLVRYGWIKNFGVNNFRQLFGGANTQCQILWTGKDCDGSRVTINALGTLFCMLIDGGYIEVPRGYGYLDILRSHVTLENGKHPARIDGGRIDDESNRLAQKLKDKIKSLLKIFYLDISSLDDDD